MGKWLAAALLIVASNTFGQAFKPGELLEYDVSWRGLIIPIPVGDASLEIRKFKVKKDIPCYHFVARAQSVLLFLFKVDDRIESYSTIETFRPVHFEKHLREGHYKKDQIVSFDHDSNTANYGNKIVKAAADCRDILGSFYFFRMKKLPAIGKARTVCVHAGKKDYPIQIQALKREKIKVSAGKFNTIKIRVSSHPDFEGLFRHKGDIWIWFSDDERLIPIKVKAKIPILGSIYLFLKKIKAVDLKKDK